MLKHVEIRLFGRCSHCSNNVLKSEWNDRYAEGPNKFCAVVIYAFRNWNGLETLRLATYGSTTPAEVFVRLEAACTLENAKAPHVANTIVVISLSILR